MVFLKMKITIYNYFTVAELTNPSFSVIQTLWKNIEISKIAPDPPREILQNAYINIPSNKHNMDFQFRQH